MTILSSGSQVSHFPGRKVGERRKGGMYGLTRDITPDSTCTLITRDLDFHQSFTHVQIDSRTHEVMAPDPRNEFTERFDQ